MRFRPLILTALFVCAVLNAAPMLAQPAEYIVNTTDDVNDGVCNVAHCSLREAIITANATPDKNTIRFSTVIDDPFFSPNTPLPTITQPVTIDAFETVEGDTLYGIWIRGDDMTAPTPEAHVGLNITGGGSTLSYVLAGGFEYAGIRLAGGGGNTLIHSFSGASIGHPNFGTPNGYGLVIDHSPNNRVENTRFVDNLQDGIYVSGSDSTGNVIIQNEIGVDVNYGSFPEYRNVGNEGSGIRIVNASHNQITENFIGFNSNYGVMVSGASAIRNRIQQNEIFENALGGIELVNGGNENHPAPVLTAAWYDAVYPAFMIEGFLQAEPHVTYRIEFFPGEICDVPGNENAYFTRGVYVRTADAAGRLAFQLPINTPYDTPTSGIIATAMDPVGNTSSFSNCILDTGTAAPLTAAPRIQVYTSEPVVLSWGEVPDVEQYQIQIAHVPGFEIFTIVDELTSATSYELSSSYDGLNLYWRVRGVDSNGLTTPWSPVQEIVVALP
jgi:trimeric autotransporter adhesin